MNAMDPAIRKLRITTLMAQVELCRITCAALESAFNRPGLAPDKRIDLFRQWDEVVMDNEAVRAKLAILKLEEQEDYVNVG